MSEIRKNEIIYEEGWRENSRAVLPGVESFDGSGVADGSQAPAEPPREHGFPLLITIQLILCVLAATALFLLRAADSEIYHDFMESYRDELKKPIISRDVFAAADEELFSDASVIVTTPDEAAP